MMVTTIGIDPHKATHTAVAIDGDETVLAEFTIRADKNQTSKLMDWATSVDGNGRVWAVEAATGLGHLLSQQLIASGEAVVDVPPVLASRFGCCRLARRTRTTRTMPAPSLLRRCAARALLR
ncbi:MAG: transposase [Acidimicrobiia bacterium]